MTIKICYKFTPLNLWSDHMKFVFNWSSGFSWADLLALLYVMLYCVFVSFPCGVLGQVWCLLSYFV